MIYIILGELGIGKTLTLVHIAMLYYLRNLPIYTNFTLKFPHTRITSIEDLTTKTKGGIFLDEVSRICNSHKAFSPENEAFFDFIADSRKKHLDVYCTAQHFHRIGKDLRNLTDEIYVPRLIYRITDPNQLRPKLTYNQDDPRPKVPYFIQANIYDKYQYLVRNKKIILDCYTPVPELQNRRPYELYYTDELIDQFETISLGVDHHDYHNPTK